MTLRYENGHGVEMLPFNLFARLGEGTGWVSGCDAEPGGSSSTIQLDYDPGEVSLDGETVDVPSQTVSIASGDPDDPRRVLTYAIDDGTIETSVGEAEPINDEYDNDPEHAPVPTTPSAAHIEGVPLHSVHVPTGASGSGDIGTSEIVDCRVPAITGLGGDDAPDLPDPTTKQDSFPTTEIEADDRPYVEKPLRPVGGETIEVWLWGVEGDGEAPPGGTSLALMSPGGSAIASTTSERERGSWPDDPVISHDVGGSGTQRYSLRLRNESGDTQLLGAVYSIRIVGED